MYLKSLVLKGFKSFADKSILAFEPGIAAIVGPNGSGKSNISDAVLWVLGERNAKNLRGQAMEDVIFAGSSARKSVSVAEVELILDNSDGTLPVDYSEVVIARRMYRNGESEYLINGLVVRRMDVLDILHDSGLGSGTHSIISQGNLDSVLRSKPEDRRELIEEAAGVLKHKQRKAKSERKLSHMDTHLTRVQDIASEVERQLKPLERKAKRAQAYQELSGELADLSLVLAVDDLRVLQDKWDSTTKKESELNEGLDKTRLDITEAEKQVERIQDEIQQHSMTTNKTADEFRKIQSYGDKLDSLGMLLVEKKRTMQGYQSDYQISRSNIDNKIEQAELAHADTTAQFEEVSKVKSVLDNTIDTLSTDHKKAFQEQQDLEQAIHDLDRRQRTEAEGKDGAYSALSEAKELLSDNLAHDKMITNHERELQTDLDKLQAEHKQALTKSQEKQAALEKLATQEKEARQLVGTLNNDRDVAAQKCDEARDEQSVLASELKALDEYERAHAATNSALNWMFENEDSLSGRVGRIAKIIKAPTEIEALVEKLLERDIQAFVVDEAKNIDEIIKGITSDGQEGEVVVYYNKTNASKPSSLKKIAGLTPVLDLIKYANEYAPVVEAILGQTYLCDTQEQALKAANSLDAHSNIIARDGFIIWGYGRMSIGVDKSFEQGVLARNRQREEAASKLEQAQKNYEKCLREKETIETKFREAQGSSLKLSQELAQLQGQAEATSEEEKRIHERLESLMRELNALQKQQEEIRNAISQARPVNDELEQQIKDHEKALEDIKAERAQKQAELTPLTETVRALSEQLSKQQLEQATLLERVSYLERVIKARENDQSALVEERITLEQNVLKKQVATKRIEPLLEVIETLSLSAKKRASALELANSADKQAGSTLHETLQVARQAARKMQESFDQANEQLSELRVEKGRLEIQVESAVNAIVVDCGTPLEKALAGPTLEDRVDVEEQAGKLRRRIANMGTINPDAAAEYEDLKQRYDYMQDQLNDLVCARRALQKIVRVIDERMKTAFIDTFHQVNENFSKIFEVLFPGGSAELSLVEPDDAETSGVEVSAQPRGKRITKMTLMSGGEKSLTALALLFAVYQTRTTPFYILDEVEAALDDSNLRRLCTYLGSLRQNTQLIMITHQRRTMELADVLYGISMQADGVTRVVSQKLDRDKEAS